MKKDEIPDKLFFSIGEVTQITGIEAYVLRYWETEFKILKPQKNLGGQRIYRQKDIKIILKIKDLLYNQKFTIAGAKNKFRSEKEPKLQLEFTKPEDHSEVIGKVKSDLESLLKFLT